MEKALEYAATQAPRNIQSIVELDFTFTATLDELKVLRDVFYTALDKDIKMKNLGARCDRYKYIKS